MKQAKGHWFLTADRRKARLFAATRTPHGRVHVDEVAALYESWDELQHDRPSPRAGRDGHSYASVGHEDQERVRRFAREIAEWLGRQVGAHDIEKVHVFSARRLLGAMRHVLARHLESRVVDHALELGDLSPGELARHRAVVAVATDVAANLEALGPDDPHREDVAYLRSGLRGAIAELRRELDRLSSEAGPIHLVGRLGGMLRMFAHHLRSQLALEATGYPAELKAMDPEERAAAEGLLADHREMEARLARLVDGVARAEEDGRRLSNAFVEGLRGLLAEIAAHESARHDLLQRLARRGAAD